MPKTSIGIVLLILALHCVLCVPSLTNFPPIDNLGDESWMMNISYSLLHEGTPIAPMHVGTSISKAPPVTTTYIYSGSLSGFIYLLGNEILSGRLLSFVASLVVVILTYCFAAMFLGRKEAGGAALLLVTNIAFSWHSREARPEMMLSLFVVLTMVIFYFGVIQRTASQKYALFIASLLATLSVQVHPHGVLLVLTLLFAYVAVFRKSLLSANSVYFLSGLVLGTSVWMLSNLSLSAASFSTIHAKYMPPIVSNDFGTLLSDNIMSFWDRHFSYKHIMFIQNKYHSATIGVVFYAALITIAIALGIGERRRKLVSLLGLVLFSLFVAFFVTGSWSWIHYSPLLPCAAVIVVAAMDDVTKLLGKYRNNIFTIMLVSFAALGTVDIAKANLTMSKYDFSVIKDDLRSEIPHDASVMGAPLYYFAFTDTPEKYYSILFLENSCPDFGSAMMEYRPEYLLIDSSFLFFTWYWCASFSNENLYFDGSVRGFLSRHGRLVKSIRRQYPTVFLDNGIIDFIDVYKIQYENP